MKTLDFNLLAKKLTRYHTTQYVTEEDGVYRYDYPATDIDGLEIVSHQVMSDLVGQLLALVEHNTDLVIGNLEQNLTDVEIATRRAIEERHKVIEENEKLLDLLNEYQANYGEIVSPNLLLHELFNGGKVLEGGNLILKEKWKHEYLKKPKHQKGVNYWINIFRDLKIFIDITPTLKSDLMSFKKAQRALYLHQRQGK
jgi:hypothetical protein